MGGAGPPRHAVLYTRSIIRSGRHKHHQQEKADLKQKYLCESYKLIFLPKFTTQQMVRRATRKIKSKTARAMMTYAHFRFRQRILDKARNYENVQVVIVNEAYTSKTCTKCGVIKANLGGAKTFKCSSCDWKGDRDINGARNIYIRSVIEAGSLVILPEGPTPPAIYSFGASCEV